MDIKKYWKQLDAHYAAGNATEHTHRPALQGLLESAVLKKASAKWLVTNEPRHIACGAPDLVLTRNNIPIGYIEAKDIGKNLDDAAHKDQLSRYTESLDNLIFTDYLEFRLWRDGKQVTAVRIAEVINGRIKPTPKNFADFIELIKTFVEYRGQTIKTATALAKRMAAKSRMMATVITKTLTADKHDDSQINEIQNTLPEQLEAFRKYLIHDIEAAAFADIYAQTVAYGMFAARLHDPTPATFTRKEAAELIPANNPFLRKFFQHIAGYDLDDRILWIVDDLADVFRAADVGELMKDYGKATQREDPFLHFYETFLGEYNPKLRKSRGVYYTPEPVVNFIVRAVDEILQTEFNLAMGLADTSKTVIEVERPDAKGAMVKVEKEVHKVQILDPATGTGTFLADIVQHIYTKYYSNQKGIWQEYVRKDLVPRLNGFEVLMASYAMAHIKLEMVLRESNCKLADQQRMRIFLTNSLEEHHADTRTVFAQWLSAEANEANKIKREMPVMVVIGNPPYAIGSSNKGDWIQNLIADYKKNLNERKINLDDDYIKFIRYGEHLVQKTGEGILAYISNNSFLDGVTHRQMRKCLLGTFDTIYILDLHGNTRKKETAPDGSPDKNVFDIQQGVSINLFVKTGKKKSDELAKVFHHDLFGTRKSKYQFLWDNDLNQIKFQELNKIEPYYFFVPKDFSAQVEYEKGFNVNKLFIKFNSGVKTDRDSLFIDFEKNTVSHRIKILLSENFGDSFADKYRVKDSGSYKLTKVIPSKIYSDDNIRPIQYRPFDYRWIYYDPEIISRPGARASKHMLAGENCGLVTSRQFGGHKHFILLMTSMLIEISSQPYAPYSVFPLYLYPETEQKTIDGKIEREPNLNAEIIQKIATALGLRFTPEQENDPKTFAPIDLLDYIYAVLHSPAYRERYKEFLKIDFPRVPYPTNKKQFRKLIKLGGELRTLHLLENPILNSLITGYPESGDNIVTKPHFEITDHKKHLGKVHINAQQHFTNVPQSAWNFPIGGYQPAQKWLKDRKTRTLTHTDITHYQKIIVALTQTERLMGEIDVIFGI